MEEWKRDARRDVVITDIDALAPEEHLTRKTEKIMDYDRIKRPLPQGRGRFE